MMPIQFHQPLQEKACKIELKNKIHLFSKKEKGRNESIRKKRNPKKTRNQQEKKRIIVSCGTEMFGKKCEKQDVISSNRMRDG